MREIHVNVPTGRESGGKKVREIQLNVPSRRGSGEREMKNIHVIVPTRTGRQAMEREGDKRNSIQCTVAPRNTGTNFICYWRIFVIANVGIKNK